MKQKLKLVGILLFVSWVVQFSLFTIGGEFHAEKLYITFLTMGPVAVSCILAVIVSEISDKRRKKMKKILAGIKNIFTKENIKKILADVDLFLTSDDVRDLDNRVWYYAGQVVILLSGILMSSMLGLIVFWIMASGGLSALLGTIMASACTGTGIPCDFDIALGVVGFSLVIVTSFSIAFIRLIRRDINSFETTVELDEAEPTRFYNDKQIEVLRFIQALNGTENLNRIANLLNVPYTTARNYVELFERDGYVKINSNGQGSPLEIEVIR